MNGGAMDALCDMERDAESKLVGIVGIPPDDAEKIADGFRWQIGKPLRNARTGPRRGGSDGEPADTRPCVPGVPET